jgi:hypothetical protein
MSSYRKSDCSTHLATRLQRIDLLYPKSYFTYQNIARPSHCSGLDSNPQTRNSKPPYTLLRILNGTFPLGGRVPNP